MKRKQRNHKNEENDGVRMELKYCERCGSLWLRESGKSSVYCGNCQPKVAELPAMKKNPGRVTLPVGQTALVDAYETDGEEFLDLDEDELDFEAAGGVA